MNFKKIVRPLSLDEAYHDVIGQEKGILIGGGVFLRLQKRRADLGIDLSCIESLRMIQERENDFVIGSMVTLRELEKNIQLPRSVCQSVRQIGGVSLRNLVTIGGSIWGRYPFSDIITALLSLNSKLQFFNSEDMALSDFLAKDKLEKDILISITIPKAEYSAFRAYKLNYTDFSMVNLSVSSTDEIRIAVGARPGRALLLQDISNAHTAEELLADVEFGTDLRGSGIYRRKMAEVMLSDLLEEGLLWK